MSIGYFADWLAIGSAISVLGGRLVGNTISYREAKDVLGKAKATMGDIIELQHGLEKVRNESPFFYYFYGLGTKAALRKYQKSLGF